MHGFGKETSSVGSNTSSDETDGGSEEEEEERAKRARERGSRDRERGAAIEVLDVPGGTIRIYVDEENDSLYAKATCDCHKDCHKQRTLLPAKGDRHTAQGRPIGFLAAWLKKGLEAVVIAGTSWRHKFHTRVSRNERCDARHAVAATARGNEILGYERPKWPEEPLSEPEAQP